MSHLGKTEYPEALRALTSVAELFKRKKQFQEIYRLVEGSPSNDPEMPQHELPEGTDEPPTATDGTPNLQVIQTQPGHTCIEHE